MFTFYYRSVITSWKIYGLGKVFFAHLIGEFFLRSIAFTCLALDNIFFPDFQKKKVVRPIFIIGHPRSGTTFLHHLLTSGKNTVAFKAWHLLFPALCARVLLKPLVNSLVKKGKSEIMPDWTGHQMALEKTDEEEMLFLHTYDTQFIPIGILGFDDREYPELRYNDQQPYEYRMKSMRFLDGCFKRQIHYTSKQQIIAQTHFSTHRLKTMLEFYPDAKFIYILRSPYHVVPSYLSLLHNSIKFRWGIEPVPEEILQRYYQRRYQAIIDLYRYFDTLQKNNKLPSDRVMVLPYDLLISDLTGAVQKIVDFTGIEFDDHLRQQVTQRAGSQKKYQRKHQVMDLKEFGLTEEMITRDFDFILKKSES
nr:sulfotransferase [Desulfobulbaceae bacterium]